jgi:SAM-dependent methyltransferase
MCRVLPRCQKVYCACTGVSTPTNNPGLSAPSKWTTWRTLNAAFYKKELATHAATEQILDFGAGEGQFEMLFRPFQNVVGVDHFPYPDVSVVCDLTKMSPFQTNVFDMVIASNVFEHLSEPEIALRECLRILKKDGCILGTVPFLLEVHQAPYDFHRFTFFMLEKLLLDAGFTDISVEAVGCPFDVYQQTKKHFYWRLLKQYSGIKNLLLRMNWKFGRLSDLFFERFVDRQKVDPKFTLGYAFKAYKR